MLEISVTNERERSEINSRIQAINESLLEKNAIRNNVLRQIESATEELSNTTIQINLMKSGIMDKKKY